MSVITRRAVAALAVIGWVSAFTIFGIRPDWDRFYFLLVSGACALTISAVSGHVITPLVAGHGHGVRAAMRAARDRKPHGRHAAPDDAKVYDFPAHR